jgi:DNA-binding Lrp family transcriptional regulator
MKTELPSRISPHCPVTPSPRPEIILQNTIQKVMEKREHFAYFERTFDITEGIFYIMDIVDTKIVAELRRNARISLSDLASIVGLSRVTMRSRLNRLQSDQTIIGFTVVLADDMHEHPVRGIMMLGIEGKGVDRILRALRGITAVQAIHSTNGKWDLIIELGTDAIKALDAVLTEIRKIDGVTASETNLLLSTQMTSRPKKFFTESE